MTRHRAFLGTAAVGALATLCVLTAAGCGHPATREECLSILNKSAELKLKEDKVEDPEQVEHRKQQLLDAKGEELIGQCVGKRITDAALRCVDRATDAAAVDRCLY
ncbi:MAG: hypothetical protein HOW73_09655 [Polyangiaceae bacterium]|nr:hypothetical protein [Polyangiaceae bacterium]